MRNLPLVFIAAAACAALAVRAKAKVVALDLPAMLAACDDAVHGTVIARKVVRIDHPLDGPELYYTTITVQGRSLIDGSETIVDLTYPGGFVSPDNGVFNSESPTDEESAVGTEAIVFHDWTDNMGGDVAGHCIVAAHGGYYPVQRNRRGEDVVLGRGTGYAVSENIALSALREEISVLAPQVRRGR